MAVVAVGAAVLIGVDGRLDDEVQVHEGAQHLGAGTACLEKVKTGSLGQCGLFFCIKSLMRNEMRS